MPLEISSTFSVSVHTCISNVKSSHTFHKLRPCLQSSHISVIQLYNVKTGITPDYIAELLIKANKGYSLRNTDFDLPRFSFAILNRPNNSCKYFYVLKTISRWHYVTKCLCFIFKQTLNIQTTITAANGQTVKAKTVFARSIKFLKDEAIKVICQTTGDNNYNADDIQWVLTVPAIWTPRAKQFMREAAYEVRRA